MNTSHTKDTLDVIALVGSLRRESFTRTLTRALIVMAAPTLHIELLNIGELPLFNQDDEDAPPPITQALRARVRRADAVLFATPEYNRSVPGVLKNAIDLASRPYGANAWAGKPAAVISTSPGAMGGFGANQHLRQVLMAIDMPAMPQPEAYIGNVHKLLDAEGQIVDAGTRDFVAGFLASFETWIRRQRPAVHEA
jgi:chromate reductase, NAD(P)H dehydrogenase (quinone)